MVRRIETAITATVTSKGQVTIPKMVRDRLASRTVAFVIKPDGPITIEPVSEVAGMLSGWAREYVELDRVREVVWSQA